VGLAPLEVRVAAPVSRPPAARSPGGRDEAGLSVFDQDLPLAAGDLSALAALQRGVVGLGDGGFSVAAQAAAQNAVTLDGASFGATSLPAEALRATAVVTSTFDPARGQFSGGQLAATTLNGTNRFGGAARLRLATPALQGVGAAGESRVVQLDGGAGGALVRDRLFWYGAVQASHRSSPVTTLQNASTAFLGNLGVSPDSVRRLQEIVRGLGYGTVPRIPGRQDSDVGRGLLRLDWAAGSDHAVMLRLDARGTRLKGLGESPFSLPGGGGELRDAGGGALLQLTSYRGKARNELRAYLSSGSRGLEPYLAGPSASVRVGSVADDSSAGSALLRFGGGAIAIPRSSTSLLELSDELVLPAGGSSRVKLGLLASREEARRSGARNPYGTFAFNSLDDLEAGVPASYTRTFGDRGAAAAGEYLALFAAHLWQPSRRLSVIYGARVEGRWYSAGGGGGAAPAELFGLRPGVVPRSWGVSPRAGFTWQSASRAWSVRGGMGEFRGRIPTAVMAEAIAETGAPDQAQLVCIGPAAPIPSWTAFAHDPSSAPATCAAGVPEFASQVPRATLFAPGWGAPRTWRATAAVDWSRNWKRLGVVGLTVEGTWLRGLSQPLAWDRNFAAVPGFSLGDEGGRSVFVHPAAVDPATGGIAPAGSRVLPSLSTVPLVRSDGRSAVGQASLGAYVLTRSLDLVSLGYTLTRARDQVGSVTAPGQASEPLAPDGPAAPVRGPADLERRHLFQLQWTRPMHRWHLDLSLVGQLTSGSPYTPRVDADVNGDGSVNDAAFVFDPAVAKDTAVANGISRLVAGAPGPVRACLREQLGQVAGRNSCRTPWSARLDAQASFWPGQDVRSRRLTVNLTAGNILAGFDRLLHGAGGVRGWGQEQTPDPILLHVGGFDPARNAFVYQVNPRFGTPAPGRSVFSSPFTLTLQVRWTFGADPLRQPLLSVFSSARAQGRSPAQIRTELVRTIPNVPAQVLMLNDTLGLALTPGQQDGLRAAADSFGVRVSPLADSLAAAISTTETTTDPRTADAVRTKVSNLSRDAQAALDEAVERVKALLTPEQWRRLPLPVQQPSRQILPQRGFTLQTGEVW
jgi:hypothetical protein